jgi:hypothetical protein
LLPTSYPIVRITRRIVLNRLNCFAHEDAEKYDTDTHCPKDNPKTEETPPPPPIEKFMRYERRYSCFDRVSGVILLLNAATICTSWSLNVFYGTVPCPAKPEDQKATNKTY